MSNGFGFDPSDEQLDVGLRDVVDQICVSGPPQERVDACLDCVAAAISSESADRSELERPAGNSLSAPADDASRRSKPRRMIAWIAASSLVCAMVAVIYNASTSVSLADVAQAVKLQKWIHVTRHEIDGSVNELWFSPVSDISATRQSDWISYHDHRLKQYWSFDVAEGVLYRVPEIGTARRQDRFANAAVGLLNLLRDLDDDSPPDDPLGKLGLFGEHRDELTLVDQSVASVDVDGAAWLDYHLTVRHKDHEHPLKLVFRVHPQTRLPHEFRMAGRRDGRNVEMKARIKYPESGPADIFDLNVPRDAQFVDRVPKDDVAQLVAGVNAGRVRFDNYRAIVVRFTEGSRTWFYEHPDVIHRKGDRMRRDTSYHRKSDVTPPGEDVDRSAWWQQRAKEFRYNPTTICIGDVAHRFQYRIVEEDGERRREIVSVTPYDYNLPPDQFLPVFWSLAPDYIARPPLGIPNQHLEPSVDLEPEDGPQGTVLLRVRRSGRAPGAPNPDADNLPPEPDAYRFWIDPDRGHLVMRNDMLGGDDRITSSSIVDETARSPRGRWYAKRVRRKNAVRFQDGTTRDQLIVFHVEFDVEIPDELFDPQNPLSVEKVFADE